MKCTREVGCLERSPDMGALGKQPWLDVNDCRLRMLLILIWFPQREVHPQSSEPMCTHLGHLGVALLHGQQQGHQGADRSFTTPSGVGTWQEWPRGHTGQQPQGPWCMNVHTHTHTHRALPPQGRPAPGPENCWRSCPLRPPTCPLSLPQPSLLTLPCSPSTRAAPRPW